MTSQKRFKQAVSNFIKMGGVESLYEDGAKISHPAGTVYLLDPDRPQHDAPEMPLPAVEPKDFVEVKAILLDALRRVASNERGRYALTCIELQGQGGVLSLTATDGRKLAHVVLGEQQETGGMRKVHVNAQALYNFVETAEKASGRNTVQLGVIEMNGVPTLVGTVGGNYKGVGSTFFMPCDDGQYPDWRAVVPRHKHEVELPEGFIGTLCDMPVAVETAAARIELEKDYFILRSKRGLIESKAQFAAPAGKIQPCVFGINPDHVSGIYNVMREQPLEVVHMHYIDNDYGIKWFNILRPFDIYLNMPIDI